MQLGQSP